MNLTRNEHDWSNSNNKMLAESLFVAAGINAIN